jgi:hypothetical protein
MIVVGYLVGFRFQAGVIPALACVALVAAFGFALSWIFAFVSLVVRGAETAQTAGFVLLFPLVFASSPTATVFACLGRSRRRPICDRLHAPGQPIVDQLGAAVDETPRLSASD